MDWVYDLEYGDCVSRSPFCNYTIARLFREGSPIFTAVAQIGDRGSVHESYYIMPGGSVGRHYRFADLCSAQYACALHFNILLDKLYNDTEEELEEESEDKTALYWDMEDDEDDYL